MIRCDFCSAPDPTWAFPAEDFTMPMREFGVDAPDWGSREGWAACDACHDLVATNEREALARRASRAFVARAKLDPELSREIKRSKPSEHVGYFRRLYAEF